MIATQPTLQMPDLLGQAYLWLCRVRAEASPHHGIWHLRATWASLFPAIRDAVKAGRYLLSPVRVMNQVLTRLGLEQHPDKTFIGRLERGFDFLGIQFTGRGEPSPSAVSLARHTEKTARLYEQGASLERIEQYRQNRSSAEIALGNWRSYLRGILGDEAPATQTDRNGTNPPPRTMPHSVLSSLILSHPLSPDTTVVHGS
jgi:hypothetical protein